MNQFPERLKLSRFPSASLLRFETLWMERDHLIVSRGYGFVAPFKEDYRRFFFRDIQGIQISGNQNSRAVTMILAILAFLSLALTLLVALAGFELLGLAVFMGVVTLGLLAGLLLHVFRGPTCTVYLKTAVQTVKLASVGRRAEAESLLARLQPLIQQAQSGLAVPPAAKAAEPPVFTEAGPVSSVVRPAENPPPLSGSGPALFWHWLTGALMPLYAAVSLADYYIRDIWPTLIGVPMVFALMLTPVVALIRQFQAKASRALALASWMGMAFSLFVLVSGYVALFKLQFEHPELSNNQWEMLKLYAGVEPGKDHLHTVLTALEVTLASCLGLVYLWITFREKRRWKPGPASLQT